MASISFEGVEQKPLRDFTEKAYLDYSMYVILDRALPHLGDGLKPVQRRIIYAMSELGLSATAKYKKSARTVGDVLGKFHPHGDTACYEAMVLMAQHFSYRYPIVDGQGNWGSPDDPKSFAAMRYTESRLSKYADVLLAELGQGTVEWGPNFDASLEEPITLPARLPNVLLNGTTGIAVGMATDIPPHNLREVVNACIHLLDNPKATLEDVMQFIQGPDFPTQAEIITPRQTIHDIYRSGNGSLKMRAVYAVEDGDIIVTALPHQVSPSKVLEQIAQQMQAKKLPMVADLRDESDHENPIRLIIIPKSNRIDVDGLMKHLFATTDLERNYRVNLNIIGLNGRPKVFTLVEILQEWLSYRTETVKRRLQFRLQKVLDRLHILDGLLIAYLNIDEVIRIIRYEEEPKQALIKRYKLSEIQADAILDLKLRHLARLEEMKITGEQAELAEERDDLEKTLHSAQRLKTLIKKELTEDAKRYGDERRSPFVIREEAVAIEAADLLPTEPITVVLSEKGWVRAAKGHDIDSKALNYRSGDGFLSQAKGRSNQLALFFDSTGRVYGVPAHTLPSARGQGEPITTRLSPPEGATFASVLMSDENQQVLVAQDAGYGFIAKLTDLFVKTRTGKSVLKLTKGSQVLPPKLITDLANQSLAAVSSDGKLLLFALADLPALAKGKGNKIMNIPAARVATREEFLVDVVVIGKADSLVIYSGKRHLVLKPSDLSHFAGERARRGNKLPRGFQKVERVEVVHA